MASRIAVLHFHFLSYCKKTCRWPRCSLENRPLKYPVDGNTEYVHSVPTYTGPLLMRRNHGAHHRRSYMMPKISRLILMWGWYLPVVWICAASKAMLQVLYPLKPCCWLKRISFSVLFFSACQVKKETECCSYRCPLSLVHLELLTHSLHDQISPCVWTLLKSCSSCSPHNKPA